MKTQKATQTQSALELFNSIVGEVSTRSRSNLELRTVNGQQYFRSCYSRRWFKTEDRAGEHKYSKTDIKIWNQIYSKIKPVQKTIEQLRAAGDIEAADKLYKDAEAKGMWKLWAMKDNTPELYANTGGLTDDELNALESDSNMKDNTPDELNALESDSNMKDNTPDELNALESDSK